MKKFYKFSFDGYNEKLPELKDKTFQWRLDYSSRTENKTIGHISYYSIDNIPQKNCLILIPGLGSNTTNEPLMKAIEYWALLNKHDIYCLDSFYGDFKPFTSQELAEKHTFAEYINLIDTGLDKIEQEVKKQKYDHACLIGHSAGATGTFEIYNDRIRRGKKLRFSASVMFAPYLTHEFTEYIHKFYKKYSFNNQISDEDFPKTAVGLRSPHEQDIDGQVARISILPTVFNDIDSVEFHPELMDKYGIPITLVAGGNDKKSPPEELRKKFNILKQGKNGHLWNFVPFKTSKHSFIDQHKDWSAILALIQYQKIRANHIKKQK
ncbi:MAG: hypothetical protein IKW67_01520 [Alphaproteobacteria bacterium]|nr:hypothetical protein [Alphaproteobacteria bacterium]